VQRKSRLVPFRRLQIPDLMLHPGEAMRRRDLIAGIAGSAAAWPAVAYAQQSDRMQRVGILTPLAENDPEGQARLTASVQALQQLGWVAGKNILIDYRWANTPETMRRSASELVALAPDVILTHSSPGIAAVLETTRTVPVVFALVADPVAAGYVESLARPGGNATGFSPWEYSTGGKWLELLKEIAPRLTRVAVIREAAAAAGLGTFSAIQALAPSIGVEVRPIDVRDAAAIERALTAFVPGPTAGLIVISSPGTTTHRDLIIGLAAKHRAPATYGLRFWSVAGGLISYGPDVLDLFRRASGYVDRILKGERPADLPVQAPAKYELLINLKTAKALGIDVPATMLARADGVIE
jgi:putative ABC transport system substrate-binding protein